MKLSLFCTALAILPAALSAQVLYLDFGSASAISGGNFNNIHTVSSFSDLIDSTGATTSIDLSLTFKMNNDAEYGAVAVVGEFPETATSDLLWGNAGGGESGGSNLTFSSLDPNLTYDLTFFASRGNTSGRLVLYTATGANSDSAVLDVSAAGTSGSVATIMGISPDASNEITINVTNAPGSTSTYFYLGAMKLTTSAVPEPSTVSALLGLAALGLMVYRRRRR